ncbi:carcinoembryonic antigen-related cell adhesion molecule 19 isoform X1 [Hyla sarda]|uniref:carcinoembryonic antigen-related cell adhesion molecule 19 isoform X1 n=1 Tax=Hyla sarda TaxID=327740 RepID=UPI0024C2B26B|nr:carcinoembryonic antigen-related cell adhesion molecule 19 isoform X1 [Hyla sarda]
MVGGSCYDTPRQVEEAAVWNDPLLQERRSTGESHNGPSSAMRGFIITVLLCLTLDVTSGMISIQLIPQYPMINGSVTLSVTGIIGDIEAVVWYKGTNAMSQYQILAHVPGSTPPLFHGPLYSPRFLAFNNGSLQIIALHTTDGGNYTVTVGTVKSTQNLLVNLTVYGEYPSPFLQLL